MAYEEMNSGKEAYVLNTAKLKSRIIAYAFALVVTGVGFFLRIVITHFTGSGLATYITFYPFIMFAAVLGGFGPGLLATLASALLVDYWFLPPRGVFAFRNLADAVGIALFVIMGVLISVVVEYYRRNYEKQVEAIHHSNIYNRSLIEASLDPLVTISNEGKITDANETAAEIRGITKEKLIGTDFSNYFTEPEKAREGYQQVFAKGFVSNYPLTIKRADGKLTDVLYNAAVYKDEKGNTLGVFAAARDITELKKSEQKLKESYSNLEQKVHNRTQDLENTQTAIRNVLEDLNIEKSKVDMARAKDEAILASIGDGMIAVDEQESIIAISSKTEKMLGWRPDEIKGKNLSDVIPIANEKGELIPKEKRPMHIALTTGKTTITAAAAAANTTTYFYVRKDGTRFPVAITVAPILFNGKIIGAIDNFRDITEEKEIDNAKTEFVSLASHQLKTPATGVKAYLAMLLEGDAGKLNPKQLEFAARAYTGNERELGLVEDLLNVARIESGRLDIEKKTIDLSEIVNDLVIQFSGAIKKHKQTIKFIKPREHIQALGDQELLWMALGNLIDNASNYSYEGGKIEVGLEKDKKNILISVKDSGVGIAKSDIDKLFQKLSRIDNPLSASVAGTGLGLYLTKKIIDLHGGEIKVTSVLGKGSVFMVQLPKSEG